MDPAQGAPAPLTPSVWRGEELQALRLGLRVGLGMKLKTRSATKLVSAPSTGVDPPSKGDEETAAEGADLDVDQVSNDGSFGSAHEISKEGMTCQT